MSDVIGTLLDANDEVLVELEKCIRMIGSAAVDAEAAKKGTGSTYEPELVGMATLIQKSKWKRKLLEDYETKTRAGETVSWDEFSTENQSSEEEFESKGRRSKVFRNIQMKVWGVHNEGPMPSEKDDDGAGVKKKAPKGGKRKRGVVDSDDDDDEVVVQGQKISLKCPLTQALFTDPVFNSICKHTYDRSAIEALIKASGRKKSVECPVGGCAATVKLDQLQLDHDMVRSVDREKKKPSEAAGYEKA